MNILVMLMVLEIWDNKLIYLRLFTLLLFKSLFLVSDKDFSEYAWIKEFSFYVSLAVLKIYGPILKVNKLYYYCGDKICWLTSPFINEVSLMLTTIIAYDIDLVIPISRINLFPSIVDFKISYCKGTVKFF